jgi:hypothetical protein
MQVRYQTAPRPDTLLMNIHCHPAAGIQSGKYITR